MLCSMKLDKSDYTYIKGLHNGKGGSLGYSHKGRRVYQDDVFLYKVCQKFNPGFRGGACLQFSIFLLIVGG